MTRANVWSGAVVVSLASAASAAAQCTFPLPATGVLYAVKSPTPADVSLEWGTIAVDDYNVWRTGDKTEVPNLNAWGQLPAVRAVAGCAPAALPSCVDPSAAPDAPSNVIFYRVRGACCGLEGLDPEIQAMIAEIDGARLGASMQTLSAIKTRHTCTDNSGLPDAIGEARDWIEAEFAAAGAPQVSLAPYTFCAPTDTRDNVLAWIPGADPSRLILVGGHYDSRTVDIGDRDTAAPGANDSGSQTSVLIEAARVMSQWTYDATVAFVALSGEEEGLQGSGALATDYATYFPGATLEVMINNDIVGGDNVTNGPVELQQFRLFSPGTPREVSGPDGSSDDTSPARGVMRHIGHWGAAYVPAMEMQPQLREDRMGRGGDHQPFVAEGIAAVRFIETVENLDHQHSADDLFDFVTPDYTARMARVIVSTLANLARAPTPPEAVTASMPTATDVELDWSAPTAGPAVHRYVIAARSVSDNLYGPRVCVDATASSAVVALADLGLGAGAAFYVSIAAVDVGGHESLFAYPEYRCQGGACSVPADALDITATD